MQNQQTSRQRRSLAALMVIGLIVPSAVAVAKPNQGGNAEGGASVEAPGRNPITRPAAQVEKVYRGPLDGAIGAHVWSGDIFGTGIVTTVSYEVALDEAGVPNITNVVVDEGSLPPGAGFEIRGGSNQSSGHDDQPKPEDPAPVVEVSAAAAESTEPSMDSTTTTTADEPGDVDDQRSTVTFAARNGVRFTMGERWAGLLLLAHGRLGEEPVIAVRTVLVAPPAERPVEETTSTTMAEEQPGERPEDRPDRERERGDRPERDRADRRDDRGDRDRGQRGDDLHDDHQKRDDRPDRGDERRDRGQERDKPPTGS